MSQEAIESVSSLQAPVRRVPSHLCFKAGNPNYWKSERGRWVRSLSFDIEPSLKGMDDFLYFAHFEFHVILGYVGAGTLNPSSSTPACQAADRLDRFRCWRYLA